MSIKIWHIFAIIFFLSSSMAFASGGMSDTEKHEREGVMPADHQSQSSKEPNLGKSNSPAFDSVEWQKRGKDPFFMRRDLFDRLIRERPFIGMTKEEVIQMLGQPNTEGGEYLAPGNVIYWLDKTDFGPTYQALEIEYQNGKVSKYRRINMMGRGTWITETSTSDSKSGKPPN